MSELVLHDVDTKLVERLTARAAERGRSVEEEAKVLLEESVGLSKSRAAAAARRIRSSYGGRKFSDSADLIREDRER